ncbi:MAG: transporter [Ignavibacteria bacterium RIFCSPHIGHO2_02_FULL_56_12]|nr:MAG: transporter [Ignavibacteria bacterium RIFCSPHIGHO2_02_FULL_56_12]
MNEHARAARSRSQLVLLLPALIPVFLLSVVPLLRGVYLGFTDYTLGDPIGFNGIANYIRMAEDVFFWKSFQVGFVWTLIVTVGQVLLGLCLALLLSRKVRFNSWYSAIMLVPWAMPPIIRGIVWRQVYDPDAGILNGVLINAGIIDQQINWLSSFEYVIPAVIVAGIWGEIPKAAVFLLAGLQSIPKDLYEAVRVDGADRWREFRHITLPMLSPVLAAVVSLSFMWNFNTFGIVWVLTQGGPGGLTRLPMLAAYEEAFRYGYVGYAAAIGNVMVLVISVVLFGYLRVQLKESRV